MKITKRQLRRLIKEELAGSGRIAYYYHGSNQPPNIMIPVFLNDEFLPGPGESGLFAINSLEGKSATSEGHYGEWVYKLRINLYGFLITDLNLARHVYGENYMPSDQIMLLIGDRSLANDAKKEEERWFSLPPNLQKDFSIINDHLIGKLFKGIVKQNGICEIFDYSKVIPVGYKHLSEEKFKKVPMEDLRKIKKKIGGFSGIYSNRRNEFDRDMYDFIKSL